MSSENQIARMAGTCRKAGMLVVTSPLLDVPAVRRIAATWSCPPIVLSPAGMPEALVGDEWIVIECHDPYENVANLLCRAMSRVEHLFADLRGPFVFAGHPREDIPGPAEVFGSNPRFEQSADGELTLLAVGDPVVSSGLLGEFFKIMGAHRDIEGRTLVDLLAAVLGGQSA